MDLFRRALCCVVLCWVSGVQAGDLEFLGVDDWTGGFTASYQYDIDQSDGLVRDWVIDVSYQGDGTLTNAWTNGYPGAVNVNNDSAARVLSLSTEGVSYRPELNAGDSIRFSVQGSGFTFAEAQLVVSFENQTQTAGNGFLSSLVSVNDWYNPSWGGGFNVTYRCDILPEDVAFGPVTDWFIALNYDGSGTVTNAWTQGYNGQISHGFIASDGGYAITNRDASWQPELYAGSSIVFGVQVQDAAFSASDFDISCAASEGVATPMNQAPVVVDQSLQTAQNETGELTLDATDPDGDALTFLIVDEAAFGSVVFEQGVALYAPSADYAGSDQFTYQASDGQRESAIATVSVTVIAANTAPVLADVTMTVDADTNSVIALDVSDADGDQVALDIGASPEIGAALIDGTQLTYTPDTGFSGT